MEIELKLAVEANALELIENAFLPKLEKQDGVYVKRCQKDVFNEYYDTPEQLLGKRKMGLRVRKVEGQFEQTVKTQGQVQGGLHQRPEYNVPLDSGTPDLHKFSVDIWDNDFDVTEVNRSIQKLFTTHFTRTQFDIKLPEGEIELVLDLGEVKTDEDSLPIQEIELELKSGRPRLLFDIADVLRETMPVRVSDVTKAARGYQLLTGKLPEVRYLPQYLALDYKDTTEDGLCKAMECALSHWQYHQALYLQTQNAKALSQVREALLLLMQSVSLYLPVLQSDHLLKLHKKLLTIVQQWSWQEDLRSIHQLRSRKGPFCKRVPKNQQLVNYLLGRREGLILAYEPQKLLNSSLSAEVQLTTSRMLIEKPWRDQTDGADIPVRSHANGWLSQSWQTVMQSLPALNTDSKMTNLKYLALEVALKQSLTNGFLLGDLFTDSRGQFRAPWLDLLQGIEELKAIEFLKNALIECDVDDPLEFKQWVEDKSRSLLEVMERSREVAMQAEVYW
uniref:CYTH domain-containing protein n=1 Tax=Ningiella ruwaisensis TaxID=2364274 RepID=UPI0010A0A674|nr:CYTH domain-containing protein [Ningiella ruwaisensis]